MLFSYLFKDFLLDSFEKGVIPYLNLLKTLVQQINPQLAKFIESFEVRRVCKICKIDTHVCCAMDAYMVCSYYSKSPFCGQNI
jgi:hypothetical protein